MTTPDITSSTNSEALAVASSPSALLTIALRMVLVMTLVTGVGYPMLITFVGQGLFNDRANGSIIEADGVAVGSSLIGQDFSGLSGYFWGRPSAAGSGYDAGYSSGSNLGPSSEVLLAEIGERVTRLQVAHPERAGVPIPVDLVTASGSGLDPHISPAAAEYQALRVARERRIAEGTVLDLVAAHTEGRVLGFLGESRVNVLELNLALDNLAPLQRP